MARADHKHVGNVLAPCLVCGNWNWEHRTRPERVQVRHDNRNRARTEQREIKSFIGLDGEGVTRADGTHDYVLLTVGKESLVHREDGRLTWREIFPFLYDRFLEDPFAAYVGYYLGYDFTQWIRTLPLSRAESLWTTQGIARRRRKKSGGNPTPFPVHVGDEHRPYQWEIDTLGMRKFKIRPGVGSHDKAGLVNPHRWMHICDVGAFFQQSFLKTLEEFSKLEGADRIVTPEEYALIAEGKTRRATAELDDAMIQYNLLECELLGRIMPLLNDGFRGMGIELSREKWFGPGQAAQAWLQNVGAPSNDAFTHEPQGDPCTHRVRGKLPCKRTEAMHAPPWAREIGKLTYFGGWFEIFCHGLIPCTSYEYDVNSAYPDQIAKLPCLLHGRWEQGKAKRWKDIPQNRTLVAVHGQCMGNDPHVGAMVHRTRQGHVLRPQMTSGWYWLHELQAAMRAGLVADFEPTQWVSYEGCDHPPPLSCMKDLYLKRLEFGKKSPRGKAAKLVYNSGYGKFAQPVGSPKFANGIYASLITAGCRVRILDAIATHPHKTRDLLMVATDGVYFRTPHPTLEISKDQLGKWDADTKENLLLFMPGLYWDDKARKALATGEVKLKSRGVPGRDMAKKILEADDLFAKYRPGAEWPKVDLSIAFSMVTVGQAIDRGKWDTCGCVYANAKRVISADPANKRKPQAWRDGDVLRTDPYLMVPGSDYASYPYDRRFGDELASLQGALGDETPDGTANALMIEALGMKG